MVMHCCYFFFLSSRQNTNPSVGNVYNFEENTKRNWQQCFKPGKNGDLLQRLVLVFCEFAIIAAIILSRSTGNTTRVSNLYTACLYFGLLTF